MTKHSIFCNYGSPFTIIISLATKFAQSKRIEILCLLMMAYQSNTCAEQPSIQFLVKWKDGPLSPEARAANNVFGSTIVRNFEETGWQALRLPPGVNPTEALMRFRSLKSVLAVEQSGSNRKQPFQSPDVQALELATVRTRMAVTANSGVTPNDPKFPQQWNLQKINAPAAWAVTTGNTNVVVAVLDSGIDYHHPDLAPNLWRNPGETGLDGNGKDKATNGIDDDTNGYIDDVYGVNAVENNGDPMDPGTTGYHGTACAGIIGSVGNNGKGIAGVNWNVQLMAVRWRGGAQYSYEDINNHWLTAWDYVIKMKRRGVNIRVTNSSQEGIDEGEAVRDAIFTAGREGILNVGIAGNYGIDQDRFTISYPGAYDHFSVLSVAASTESDSLTSFSSFGRSTVDIAAPGVNITSTTKSPGYENGLIGTSFAAPQVAGAAALLFATKQDATVLEVRAALLGSADPFPSLKGKVVSNGRLNVARALEHLTNSEPLAIVVSATPTGQRTARNAPIEVYFNKSMDRQSVESAFIAIPPLSGEFNWREDSHSFIFLPDRAFDQSTNYVIRILATALDDRGSELDGNFNRIQEGSPGDDFVWSFRFPIPNDDFADAQSLSGRSGEIAANNRYALNESWREPWHANVDNGASLWYRWTPPEPGGWFTFDLTGGTAFDSIVAIYTGVGDFSALLSVAANDNYGTKASSRASFNALAGTTYSIVVCGKANVPADDADPGKTGNFKLAWYPTPPPGFTGSQFSPSTAPPGGKVTLTGTNFTGATAILFNGASATFTNALTNNLDLRITTVVPPDATSGPITIVTPHGNTTSTASFQVSRPTLTLTRPSETGLSLSWTGTNFSLDSSTDLKSWTQFMPSGKTNAALSTLDRRGFFRLRAD